MLSYIICAFQKGVDCLSQASSYTEATSLGKAAKILIRHMIDHEFKFDVRFHESCVEYAIPPSLFESICMIEHGVDIKSQLRFSASKKTLLWHSFCSITAIQDIKRVHQLTRHSKERETHFLCF